MSDNSTPNDAEITDDEGADDTEGNVFRPHGATADGDDAGDSVTRF